METNPYSIESLWHQGDMVIKAVAVMLLVMSVLSWCIILLRAWGLLSLRGALKSSQDFWHAHSIGEGMHMLGNDKGGNPFRQLAEVGQAAVDHHEAHQNDLHGKLPMADWLTSCLRNSIDESAERLQGVIADDGVRRESKANGGPQSNIDFHASPVSLRLGRREGE